MCDSCLLCSISDWFSRARHSDSLSHDKNGLHEERYKVETMAFVSSSLPILLHSTNSKFNSNFVTSPQLSRHVGLTAPVKPFPGTKMTSVQPSRPSPIQSDSEQVDEPSSSDDECPVYCYVACSPTRSDYLERVLTSNVYDVVPEETPLHEAPLLSDKLKPHKVYLKREDSTAVNSFKIRGAYNMISKTDISKLKNGVVAASAGNHAQGVALSAEKLNIPATIVMPAVTPQIKVDAVKRRGAKTILYGDNFDQAKKFALELSQQKKLLFIPPFDHPDIIAGQATVGLELMKQLPNADVIFVPIGGGGLIAGIATVVKRLKPSIKIIGVEPFDSPAMYHSLKVGKRVKLKSVGTFADGVAVVEVGEENFRLCKDLVDDVILVSNDEICAAIKDVFEETRSILEPAGALATAGLKRWVFNRAKEGTEQNGVLNHDNYGATKESTNEGHQEQEGLKLVAIASGANTNFDALRHVSERAEIGEGREGVFAITIPEKPGSFRRLMQLIGSNTNITEFNYRLRDSSTANVFVGARVRGIQDRRDIIHRVTEHDFEAVDLTNDEMTKLHVRHLVGGSSSSINFDNNCYISGKEMVLRFEFPERPGALYKFLAELPQQFNITMFHYRNHGADVGRVLVGLTYISEDGTCQVEDDEETKKRKFQLLDEFVNRLGYKYTKENHNVAYKLFLS